MNDLTMNEPFDAHFTVIKKARIMFTEYTLHPRMGKLNMEAFSLLHFKLSNLKSSKLPFLPNLEFLPKMMKKPKS